MRPTGKLHLGHLVGALDNWVKLQEEYDCFFMAADWHALMSEYEDTSKLSELVIDNVIDWLSVGIDPKKSTLFVQSQVNSHLDLYMIFSCLTPLGRLERCPTYKEQMREIKTRNLNTYGFLGYPVLQAADILLYKSDKVPVGQDQLPHLELTREIARRFNGLYPVRKSASADVKFSNGVYKKKVFPYPEAILTSTPRLLGLDGRKMSKSYNNTVDLSDPEDLIKKKIADMFTDPQRIKLSDKGHPDACNVFTYYATFIPGMKDQVHDWCAQAKLGCTDCKKQLALGIIEKLRPIQQRRQELLKDKNKIKKILQEGNEKASAVASKTLKEVRGAMQL